MNDVLDIIREDFGSVMHRRSIAARFELDVQEVIDMPKREFKTLVIGLTKGRISGKLEASEDIKNNFFCVPIDFWKHREADFKKILKEEIDELKANKAGNDDSNVETESDSEAKTENSEEQ